MLRNIVLAMSVVMTLVSFREDPSVAYITQYKEIAISEMHRTGIPASIKLAQALLESGAGNSSLANDANNHFGIKCGGQWNGQTYYLHDDDYNSKGHLIKSCFRQFSSPKESFIAHSNFLVNQNRYAFLFKYDHRDYHAWAKGLKKAGYATDKLYPQKLINLIEKYQLFFYDDLDSNDADVDLIASKLPVPDNKNQNASRSYFEYPEYTQEAVVSKKSSSRRKTKKSSSSKNHLVRQGETIAEIGMMYDLDENSIRLRNRLPKNAEPLPGEKIHLRKKISLTQRPQFPRVPDLNGLASQEEYIF